MNNEVERQGIGIRKKIVGAAESLAQKLNQEIEKGNDDTAFMIALFLAGLKDFLDIILTLVVVGLVPGVSWGIGLFLTSFLFFFMLGKGWFLRLRLKIWFWVLGLIFDGIPGFNTLPTNVLLVLYAWRLTKKRSKHAKEKLQDLHTMTDAEIAALNNNISLLEQEEIIQLKIDRGVSARPEMVREPEGKAPRSVLPSRKPYLDMPPRRPLNPKGESEEKMAA